MLSTSTAELQSANRTTAPMYIVNPLHKKGMKVSDLSSTHPPISERIKILRSMGGASLADYDKAFRQVHKGGGSVIPASAVGAGAAGLAPAVAIRSSEGGEPGEVDRARETTDVLWKLNNYDFITCKCGTKLKIPPKFKKKAVKCPHCGTINPVKQ